MQVLMTILYILLFLVFLSILIIVHELGHLIAAKSFNVFCLEYSIGMGPLIFKKKRKNGETQFSIRAIPFGGYVSMYGEGVEVPEGVEIPPERSLNNVKWWKRGIIFLAGVTMNAILALVFFAVSNCFPQEYLYRNAMNVAENSIAYNAGLRDADVYKIGDPITYEDPISKTTKTYYLVDDQTTLDGDDSIKYATCINLENITSFKNRDMKDVLFVYSLDGEGRADFTNFISPVTFATAEVHFSILKRGVEVETVDHIVVVSIPTNSDGFESFGADLFYEKKFNTFGEVVKYTFEDFGQSSILLFRAIGDLIIKPASWQNVGGIIAVGFETTSVLQNFGFGKFLYIWGFISVNLAIFNLLPFPGLDGWQLLVLGVETATRKKIPEKVKNIVSMIGIGLLLLLMGVVVVKDLITYVFMVGTVL